MISAHSEVILFCLLPCFSYLWLWNKPPQNLVTKTAAVLLLLMTSWSDESSIEELSHTLRISHAAALRGSQGWDTQNGFTSSLALWCGELKGWSLLLSCVVFRRGLFAFLCVMAAGFKSESCKKSSLRCNHVTGPCWHLDSYCHMTKPELMWVGTKQGHTYQEVWFIGSHNGNSLARHLLPT